MESDDDSRSSNSSGSSNSSSNGPASPPQNDNENESNDQPPQIGIQQVDDERSRSLSQDSNSFQSRQDDSNQGNKSPSPVHDKNNEEEQSKDGQIDEEELELSDIDDEESNKNNKKEISHEDLSDISDLESSNEPPSPEYTDLRQKLQNKRQNGSSNDVEIKNDEDELDFEDDEVKENSESVKKQPPQESKDSGNGSVKEDGEHKSDKEELESGEELEDGEVTDGDEKRPEESEPKAVCRFFTRGQCTWGMSCRFLHPGTTDKGNYTMFDLVRPIPVPQNNMGMMPSYDYRTERPPIHHPPHIPPHFGGPARPPPPSNDNESAWERGLRTAKEMLRKANKRKEQDMDFDEKKMNLSGPPDEVERDPYYVRGSPEDPPPFEKLPRGPPMRGGPPFSPPAKFARTAFYEEDQYGRMPRSYRELPPHRMPHYEDEEIGKRRPNRPTREVIVEKASDDWNDPWMRKKSPGGRGGNSKGRKGRERSYSSNSSYSSSSSSSRSRSRSRSSSDSSPTPSNRRRFDSKNSRERITPRKVERKSRSTSLKRRHSPVRARVVKKAISPIAIPKRAKKQASPTNRTASGQRKKRDSSSSTGGSESDSSYSSSTSSSKGKKRREKLASERKPATKKVEMTKKRASPPQQPAAKEDDKPVEKPSEKASAAAKLKSSRREELLKQLKAVEDAIARKRSKIT